MVKYMLVLRLMEEILHHDRCMNPKRNVITIMATGNGCRVSSINSVMVCHGKCFITFPLGLLRQAA